MAKIINSIASTATSFKAVGKVLGKVESKISSLTSDPVLGKVVSQGWRNALFVARALSVKPKDTATGPDPAKGNIALVGERDLQIKTNLNLKNPVRVSVKEIDPAQGQLWSNKQEKRSIKIQDTNKVIIYNLTRSPYEYIELQNRPQEILNQSQTSWAEIKSMGRNLPMYHYLGGQDEIHFNISWYCNDPEHPEEVLVKCRLLESWTKSNGYQAAPPVLRIQWGSSDLFKDQLFILTSATYTLANFRSISRDFRNNPEGDISDAKLYPGTATQELIFKRVSTLNLSQQDYVTTESMKGITGIVYKEDNNQESKPAT